MGRITREKTEPGLGWEERDPSQQGQTAATWQHQRGEQAEIGEAGRDLGKVSEHSFPFYFTS